MNEQALLDEIEFLNRKWYNRLRPLRPIETDYSFAIITAISNKKTTHTVIHDGLHEGIIIKCSSYNEALIALRNVLAKLVYPNV